MKISSLIKVEILDKPLPRLGEEIGVGTYPITHEKEDSFKFIN